MALPETSTDNTEDRSGRRRPFSTWVRKLAKLKSSSSHNGNSNANSPSKKSNHMKGAIKNRTSKKNNPYPESGRVGNGPRTYDDRNSVTTGAATRRSTTSSLPGDGHSLRSSSDGRAPPTAGARSMAPTVSTEHDVAPPSSVAGTSRTVGGGVESRRGGDSTFSSPAPSVRSLTTTLTTIQSLGPNGAINAATQNSGSSTAQNNAQTIQFSQPFPTASPASAIPPHLAPHAVPNQPNTYATATANNLLTDNASILTLASSSKRRRRRSMDTDASVRALAPSSLWGGSRESLPLSVLSANAEAGNMPNTPGLHQTSSRIGPSNERTSIYSVTGVTPALPSDRNSFYAKQNMAGDTASVRSGLLGHSRADSVTGSIGGLTSPLASPREVAERDPVEEKDESPVQDKADDTSGENVENSTPNGKTNTKADMSGGKE